MHPIINKIIYKFNHQQKYALALKLIEDFISSPGHYFPITTSSLDVHSLACVINDIIINERKKYVEFGSGISTIAIARLIKANNLKTHIYSVEDNGEWLNIMKKYLQKEGLLDTVTFLHCPLERSKFSKQGNNWYSEKVLNEKLGEEPVDIVLVDGPSTWSSELNNSRYPALPFLNERLASSFSFYLHDIQRKTERQIIDSWRKEFGLQFENVNHRLSYTNKGNYFNSII